MNFSLIKQSLGFLALVALLVFAIIFSEIYWIRITESAIEDLAGRNLIQKQGNERQGAEIQALKANRTKISAMFVRLNDAVFNGRPNETVRGQINDQRTSRLIQPEGRPPAIQLLTEAGIIVQPGRLITGEPSLIFEAGSSRLELERLIPLFAEAENSNAFLYLDRLFLSRPAATQPFSTNPTYLDARFTVRVLATR